eukprot:CAMPEP_0168172088 /NCGR_PEP_ID=MMETSP0139_2-20121125/5052_1 /TAXON_ID=44445 /ORGANISM="Pseudo-nitzschia australis, Strain 10249 10 AB" /LENGTH=964 /DNA_ID=CAMNT_0008089685 /DNA_START=123 /DNA_END=3017 /DNA_ORIENTATION=-
MTKGRRKEMERHRPRLNLLVGRMTFFSVCLGGTLMGSSNTAFAYVPRNHRISVRRARTIRRNNPGYTRTALSSSKIAPERPIPTNATNSDSSIEGNYHPVDTVEEQKLHRSENTFSFEEDFFHGDGIPGVMSSRMSGTMHTMHNIEHILEDMNIDETISSVNDVRHFESNIKELDEWNLVNRTSLSQNEDRLLVEGSESLEFQIGGISAIESEVTIGKVEEKYREETKRSYNNKDEVRITKTRTSLFRRVRLFSRIKSALRKSTPEQNDPIPNVLSDANDEIDNESDDFVNKKKPSSRQLWRKRNARTLEEGIRREQKSKLSSLINKALVNARPSQERSYIERLLMGLVNGLAEEAEDLDIELNTISKTPFWRKEVEEIRINFSRLGFRPIQIGGSNSVVEIIDEKADVGGNAPTSNTNGVNTNLETLVVDSDSSEQEKGDSASLPDLPSVVDCADEGFDRIDGDGSGTLDKDELAQALNLITGLKTNKDSIEELASDLVQLYDDNGDGVVDREEYKRMVEDMYNLRTTTEETEKKNPFVAMKDSIQSVSEGISSRAGDISSRAGEVVSAARDKYFSEKKEEEQETEMGSIVLSNVNLDLRRLVFGAFPIIKKITPGGPLILEPFTATVTASFSPEDVMGSFLLDAALGRLVARALRVRVRSYRDLVEGALFVGRQWKMESKAAPVVEVLGLSSVEFDSGEKLIVTGRAKIRADPDAPIVTSTFKLRTKLGTRKNGQVIKLKEPELAFVFECPKALERGLGAVCKTLGLPPPNRPEPYYSFFPIYSPFKVDDDTGGFDMGEDNCIRSIFVRNGKLRFEMSVVLRPGRFLGNHYLAFTVPQRTFIITMDRVWNGIRAARENKQVADRAKKLKEAEELFELNEAEEINDPPEESMMSNELSTTPRPSSSRWRFFKAIKDNTPKPKSFYTRFIEGYTMLDREEEANNERMSNDISAWFGRQGGSEEE